MSNEPLTIEGMKRIIIEIIDFWCIKNCSDHSDSICNCVANQATIIAFLDELEFLRKYIASEKVEANNKKLRAAAESDHHEHEKMLAEHSKLIKRTGELEKENEQLRIDKDSLGARISRLQATQKGHLYGPSVRKG